MPNTKIPSPARSQGASLTPRRNRSRRSHSVNLPAPSNASGRLTALIKFNENNMDSLELSPMNSRLSVLTDNTEVEEPKRKSWWKKLDDNPRDVLEVLDHSGVVESNNILEELDFEVMSPENKNYSLDVPDSSGSESICSIVVPPRKLFGQKENLPQNKFDQLVITRESMAKNNETNVLNQDRTLKANVKTLFGHRTKITEPIFPEGLLNISSKSKANKTKETLEEPRNQVRKLFGNRPTTKRKNMFADFHMSERDDEIPEIQPRLFTFQKKVETCVNDNTSRGERQPSLTPNVTTEIEMDEWKMLPSSTMVENQLEDFLTGLTPVKKARLSKLSQTHGSKIGTNIDVDAEPKHVLHKSSDKLRRPSYFAEKKTITEEIQNENGNQEPDINQEHIYEVDEADVDENDFTLTYDDDNKPTELEVRENAGDKQTNVTYIENDKTLTQATTDKEINDHNEMAISTVNDKAGESEQEIEANNLEKGNLQVSIEDEIEVEQQHLGEGANNQNKTQTEEEKRELKNQNKSIGQNIENEQNYKLTEIRNNKISNDQQKDECFEQNVEEEVEIGQQDKNEQNVNVVKEQNGSKDNNEGPLNKSQIEVRNVHDENIVEHNESQVESNNEQNDSEMEQNESEDENYEEQHESQVEASNKHIDSEVEHQDESEDENDEEQNNSQIEASNDQNDNEVEQQDDSEGENDNIQNESQVEASNEQNDSQVEQQDDSEEENDEEQNESHVEASNEQNDSQVEQQDDSEEENDDEQNESHVEASNGQNDSQVEQQDESEEENDDEQNESHVEASNGQNDSQVEQQDDSEEENDDEKNESDVEASNEQNDSDVEQQNDSEDENNDEQNEFQVEASNQQNESHEESDDEEMDVDDVDNLEENEHDDNQEIQNESEEENISRQAIEKSEEVSETPNTSHDTTGRNRKRNDTQVRSPEAVLEPKSHQLDSFMARARNTSIRKTKSIRNLNASPSLAPIRDSIGITDGTKDSSVEGSGWDSHRTTRKTLRQTLGKDFTLRKSLRTLVMEKSAKRHTEYNEADVARVPQANSTEFQDSYRDAEEVVDESDTIEESNHEASRVMRQQTLEIYLQEVKKRNMEERNKIKEAVNKKLEASLKAAQTQNQASIFKVPARPNLRKPTKPQSKPKTIDRKINLPPEILEDMKYKPPKRFRPSNASWLTKRLYKFLETKLEPRYDYKARVRAEKLAETIYNFTKEVRRHQTAPTDMVHVLKHEMARLNIVRTHFDFYEFFHDFMPREIRTKVVPDLINKIPLPRHGVFTEIL